MKVVLTANTSWYLHNFRGGLIRRMVADGVRVVCLSPRDEFVPRLEESGATWRHWEVNRRGRGPVSEWAAMNAIGEVYAQERPDVVHHFTIKPVLYGTRVARRLGVSRIVNNVTGLGHMFISRKLSNRAVRPAIRRWLVKSLTGPDVRAVFQSRQDYEEVSAGSEELQRRAVVVPGSGVDTERVRPSGRARAEGEPLRAVFIGRLIEEKGVRELAAAAEELKAGGFNGEIVVCGTADPGNPSSIDAARLERWKAAGAMTFAGHVDDIPSLLGESDAVVLPSYREGTSRVLLEAAAAGLPAVASNVPGCRDVVVDGQTGLLVPVRQSTPIAAALRRLAGDAAEAAAMGRAARKKAVAEFEESRVIDTLRSLQNGEEPAV